MSRGLVSAPRVLSATERAPRPHLPDRAVLIDRVRAAGLRGRGGAWFPTATKLAAVAAAAGRRGAAVIANGVEGEPLSQSDHALLSRAPHLVLDGIALAAHAVAAREAVLCVRVADPLVPGLRAAIAQRATDPVPVRLAELPDRFVASEETALVNFLNTGDARPTGRPPVARAGGVPAKGLHGRPTLVNNVETLADLALVGRYGPEWFRSVGVPSAPGTALMTAGGAVDRPGVYEIPLGLTVADLLGIAGGRAAAAVLVGGFGGTWLGLPGAGGLPLAPDELVAAGASLGVGMVLALPAGVCGLAVSARIVRYLASQSARQCGPCLFGLPAVAADLDALAGGRPVDLVRLRRRLGLVRGRGACRHPDGAVRLAASALSVFAHDVAAHAAGRPCGGVRGDPGFPIPMLGVR
jgi:NADH:ubiquinone oxidoreductase subunit F (NADH-binding)